MKNSFSMALMTVIFILSGCSVKHSPYADKQNGVTIYEVSKKQASSLAHKAVKDIVPSDTVGEMYNGMGYFATERSVIDQQTYTVKLVPLQGEAKGRVVQGFSFDVYSDGTLFHGPSVTKKLLNYTVKLFDETGKGIVVKNAVPRKIEDTSFLGTSSLEVKLENLKKLYDKGLITSDEYKQKRKELLDQY